MDFLKDLNSDQIAAVKQTEGPVLILAGAGSGKTRVLTYKVAYLIGQGVDPASIICVTFTNKAANEMKERVHRLLTAHLRGGEYSGLHLEGVPGGGNLPYVGTFHAFCAKLLRLDGKFIGIPTGYVIYDNDDSLSLVKKIMADLAVAKSFRPSSILSAISSAKSELLSPVQYGEFARGQFAETVFRVYQIYQKGLEDMYACDFDDLLTKTVALFRTNGQILEKWAGRFRYVLVDEYQDVNTAQYVLTKLLASRHGNLTVVGDASQAIYSFRGADFRNILNFERDFPKVRVFNLERNYRSTKTILSAANAVIAKNSSHPILALWTKNEHGDKISIYNAASEIDEANFVTDIIVNNSPTNYELRTLNSFAILYRTNAQSRTVEEALLHEAIPYRLYGGVSFYARKEVKDVLAYLRLITNPGDKVSRVRVEKLGKKRLEKFDEMVKKLSTSGVETISPTSLIDAVLEATDYLTLIDDGTEQGLSRVENVKELKSVAADFSDLPTFLQSVTLMEGMVAPQKSYEDGERDAVTLMTIHAAKGLEFDHVFIIGMEEGLFPHARSMLEPAQLEEERRLAYVGMTRAKKKLYLTYATNRLYFGTRSSNLVSRFVVDIPEELITAI